VANKSEMIVSWFVEQTHYFVLNFAAKTNIRSLCMIFTANNESALQQVKLEQLEQRISFLSKTLDQIKQAMVGFATSDDLIPLQQQLAAALQLEQALQQLNAQLDDCNQAIQAVSQNKVSLSHLDQALSALETELQQFALTAIAQHTTPSTHIIISRWS